MHLPLRAQGATLTDEEAKILDDEFFLSNPLSHFSSRVSMLLKTARSNYEANPENEPEFFKALGLDRADTALKFDARHRSVQVAIDALSLRHQAAEALTRFIYARVAAAPRDGDAKSTWLAIAGSPTPMIRSSKPTRRRSMQTRADSSSCSSSPALLLRGRSWELLRRRWHGRITPCGC